MRFPIEKKQMSDHMKGKISSHNRTSVYCKLIEGKINPQTIASSLIKLWNPDTIQYIQLGTDGVIQIWLDKRPNTLKNVLYGQPWIVEGHTLLLQTWSEKNLGQEVNFERAIFWVHLLHLPPLFMDKPSVDHVVGNLGRIWSYDFPPKELAHCLSVRVKLQIHLAEPFPLGSEVDKPEGGKMWIPFAYEYLPKLCYDCGKVGHGNTKCIGAVGGMKDWYKNHSETMRAVPRTLAHAQSVTGIGGSGRIGESSDGTRSEPTHRQWIPVPSLQQGTEPINLSFSPFSSLFQPKQIPAQHTGPLGQSVLRPIEVPDDGPLFGLPQPQDLPTQQPHPRTKPTPHTSNHTHPAPVTIAINPVPKPTPNSAFAPYKKGPMGSVNRDLGSATTYVPNVNPNIEDIHKALEKQKNNTGSFLNSAQAYAEDQTSKRRRILLDNIGQDCSTENATPKEREGLTGGVKNGQFKGHED